MNWKEYIVSDPDILIGKPTVKGTRLAVDFILGLLSDGWSEDEILANYPALTKESLQAIFAFTRECMQTEAVFDIR